MRALAIRGNGKAEVDLVDVPEPDPEGNEAVVQVAAAAVNRGELRLMSMRDQGWRPGQDVAGTVVAQAADGSGPGPGTRVVAWPEQAGWAEKVAVPTTHLGELDERVSYSEAATIPIAGITALRALRRCGPLLGKRVVVTGASGGVGRFAVELAAHSGAHVIGVSRNAERAAGLAELGVSAVVTELDQLAEPADVILEAAGGPSLEAAVRNIGPGGKIMLFGNSANEAAQISFGDFRGKPGASIEAFFVYESGQPPTFGSDLQFMADLVANGRLHPEVGLEVPWSEANAAFAALANREVVGKAVLVID